MTVAGETRLFRFLLRRWWAALLLLGLSFVLFGVASYNLFDVLQANLRFIAEHGLMAVMDGALLQLAELLAYGYAAAICYTGWKLCEKALVWRLSHHDED